MDPWWGKPIFLTWQSLTNTNPLDINLLIPFQGSESPSIGNAGDMRVRWLKLITVFESWLKIQNPATLHAGRALCLDEGLKQDYGFRVRAWSLYVSNMRILRDEMLRSSVSYAGFCSPMLLFHTHTFLMHLYT